jgi:hypothetical protein
LVWNVAGGDIGVAIHRTDNKPFNGNMVMERTALCSDPNNYSCGNISFHGTLDSNFDPTINPAFAVGDIRSYALAYDVGTPDQLAALGYDGRTDRIFLHRRLDDTQNKLPTSREVRGMSGQMNGRLLIPPAASRP